MKSQELVRGLLRLEKDKADCRRRSVACVLTLNGVVVGKGHNSLPIGSCLAGECPRGLLSYEEAPKDVGYENPAHPCYALHAEDDALEEAGVWAQGAIAWITEQPCPRCQQRLKDGGVVDFIVVDL